MTVKCRLNDGDMSFFKKLSYRSFAGNLNYPYMQNRFFLKLVISTITFWSANYNQNCLGQQTSGSNLVWPTANNQIAFEWQGDSVHTSWEPHSALLIPVKLPNCPVQFSMQFD